MQIASVIKVVIDFQWENVSNAYVLTSYTKMFVRLDQT